MPEIRPYNKMRVSMVQSTPQPKHVTAMAAAITMRQDIDTAVKPITHELCLYLLEAEHTSIFEHVSYTFLIDGVSRSFLAQITRHRIGSFTSASQHYQDYRDYPCVVHMNLSKDALTEAACASAFDCYQRLIATGTPVEEARQVLPNAAAVNLLWTVNARSLINFLRLRLCNRNVMEMKIFARAVLSRVQDNFPELFNYVGPQCYMGECKQGRMRCKEGIWTS